MEISILPPQYKRQKSLANKVSARLFLDNIVKQRLNFDYS